MSPTALPAEPLIGSSQPKTHNRINWQAVLPPVLVTLVFVTTNVLWSAFDHGLPDWDTAEHILNGLTYRDLLRNPHLLDKNWIYQFLTVNYLYPPAVYIFSAVIKLVLGIQPWVDVLIRTIYQAVLCISVYNITNMLAKSRLAAVLSVVFINLYPQTSVLSHQLMLDFPTLSMVALALWALLSWQEKPSHKRTVIVGFTIAFACLTKQLAGAFLVAPAFIVFLQTIIDKRFKDTGKLIASATIPLALSLPWLMATYPSLKKLAAYNTSSMGTTGVSLTFASEFTGYIAGFLFMMSPALLVGFIASLLLASSKTHRTFLVVSSSTIGGLLLLSTLTWAYPLDRYAMSALITPALYTGNAFAYAFNTWSSRFSQKILRFSLIALLFIGVLQFLILNYAPYPLPVPSTITRAFPILAIGPRSRETLDLTINPQPYDWGQSWTLETIKSVDKVPVYLNIMPDSSEFNVHTFQYLAKLCKSQVVPTTSRQWSVTGDTLEFSPEKAMYYHWYLIKTGFQGHFFQQAESQQSFDKLINFVRQSSKFRLVATRSLPDRSILFLYRQK